ncbi:MAG TPA: SDR family NAD(P)-dependent oxidoreductase [Rhizomicrobium sp.]|jgi:NAD(P)-dependent dehydrogenase (short-subunit alcohol dehydrogenase family)|nr:SDR family NAD(P)-dependent oxidoreductase [Rhizomicrobium sp.]
MISDFRGKTAFITGGASGIGLSMARAFGRAGMNVVLADIDEKAAKAAAEQLASEQIKAAPVFCDVTERSSVQSAALQAVERFGKVHVVCNNAGVAVGGQIGTVKPSDWDWIIDANLKGVVYGTETFVPLIKSHGEGGHIVNTASMAGMISPPGMEPYSATKFAVVAMSEGWFGQLAPMNIGVSVLCPGFVKTHIHESGRNRQQKYGGEADVDPGLSLQRDEAAQLVLSGIDPDVVGARVVEAVKAGDLYIFTHPMMRAFVEHRFEMIKAGFDAAENSPAIKAVKEWASPVPRSQQ